MRFENYMQRTKLMYFKVVVFDSKGNYTEEFDNYEERNYTLELVRKYADYAVTNQDVVFKKVKGYTVSTTLIHIKEVV
jgi:hypothetical protein